MRMSLMRRVAALCRGTIFGARPAVVVDNASRIRGEFLGNSSDAVLGSRRYGATPVKSSTAHGRCAARPPAHRTLGCAGSQFLPPPGRVAAARRLLAGADR